MSTSRWLVFIGGLGVLIALSIGGVYVLQGGDESSGPKPDTPARVGSAEPSILGPDLEPILTADLPAPSQVEEPTSRAGTGTDALVEPPKPVITGQLARFGSELLGMSLQSFMREAEASKQAPLIREALSEFRTGQGRQFIEGFELAAKNLPELERAGAIEAMTMRDFMELQKLPDVIVVQLQGVEVTNVRGTGPVMVAVMRESVLPGVRALLEKRDALRFDTRKKLEELMR